jgi:acetyl esterase/lipase
VELARELAEQGVPSLRFDHLGRGVSEGDARTAHLDGMIADAVAACQFLRGQTEAEDVVLVGMCSGGNVAMGAATLLSNKVAGVVGISVLPFTAPDARRNRRRAWTCLRQYLVKACRPATWLRLLRGEVNLEGVSRTARGSLSEGDEDRRLKTSARNIPAELHRHAFPVHLIYGGGDPEAAPAQEWYASLLGGGERLSVSEVSGANHNFYSVDWAQRLRTQVRQSIFAGHPKPEKVNSAEFPLAMDDN